MKQKQRKVTINYNYKRMITDWCHRTKVKLFTILPPVYFGLAHGVGAWAKLVGAEAEFQDGPNVLGFSFCSAFIGQPGSKRHN